MEKKKITNIDNLLEMNITYKSPLFKINEKENEENRNIKDL